MPAARGAIAAALSWCHAARDIAARDSRRDPASVAAARTRRRAAGKAIDHDRLRSSATRGARSTHQKLGIGLVVWHAGARHRRHRRGVLAVNGLFLRPFPFPEPERLVYINETAPKWNLEIDRHQLRRLRAVAAATSRCSKRSRSTTDAPSTSPTDDGADRMHGAAVTIDFPKVLGMQPCIGRMFTAEEDRPKGPRVAVIGEALWRERFGGRADVLGKELQAQQPHLHDRRRAAARPRNFPAACASGCRCRATRTQRTELQLRRARPAEAGRHASNRPTPICCARSSRSSTRATRNASSRRSRAICASSSRAISARSPRRSARRSRCCSSSPARTSPR